MQVFKFGGASVAQADAIRNVADILRRHRKQPTVVVVSAMAKTTNALEALAQLATQGQAEAAMAKYQEIKDFHLQTADILLGESQHEVKAQLYGYLQELKQITEGILLLGDFPDRIFDRIMAYGELMSSVILAGYLNHEHLNAAWADARQLIATDSQFRSAEVIWRKTETQVRATLLPQLNQDRLVVTQGFIGQSPDGHTTTLGREGSDFTASILAYCLDADRVVVWKDVPGVMSADPRSFPEAVKLDQLSYQQAVEMTFYGASVIHPKTIKPLQNKGIPLQAKCFLDTSLPGTTIGPVAEGQAPPALPTIILQKKQQLLLRITPRDLSFMDVSLMREVFIALHSVGLKINLVQSTAVSLTVCVNHTPDAENRIRGPLADRFVIEATEGIFLKSYLHVGNDYVAEGRQALVIQREGPHVYLVLPNEYLR